MRDLTWILIVAQGDEFGMPQMVVLAVHSVNSTCATNSGFSQRHCFITSDVRAIPRRAIFGFREIPERADIRFQPVEPTCHVYLGAWDKAIANFADEHQVLVHIVSD